MRKLLMTAVLAATTLAGIPAGAQSYRDDRRDARQEYHDDGRDDRRDNRQDARGDRRDDRRDGRGGNWQRYRSYDYSRPQPGQRGYYADQYYRDGRYYQPRRLGRNDRIYRGQNGRYYCRRSDGTTGLIVGGIAGGLLGNALTNGRSELLGTLVGAGGGALLGQSVDRGNVSCR
jgi:hypothetical protein